jgi:ABC-2 type transport system permease protein
VSAVLRPPSRARTFQTASWPRMLAAQTRAVLIFYRRSPGFLIPSLALPLIFYAFFGVAFQSVRPVGGTSEASLMITSIGAYAVSAIMVFNVGIGQAQRRAQKQDLLQRATPLPSPVAIGADAAAALVLALVALAILFTVGSLASGVRLSAGTWVATTALLLVGSLPIMGLGLALGYSTGSSAASALANLIYLPMSFISGLFIPLQDLPPLMQAIGRLTPTYHYAQLAAYLPLGAAQEPPATAVAWLIGWGIVLFGLAGRAYARDRRRKFA